MELFAGSARRRRIINDKEKDNFNTKSQSNQRRDSIINNKPTRVPTFPPGEPTPSPQYDREREKADRAHQNITNAFLDHYPQEGILKVEEVVEAVEEVNKVLAKYVPPDQLQLVTVEGDDGPFLFHVVKVEYRFRVRLPLIHWAMTKYKEANLYLQKKEGKVFFEWAAIRFQEKSNLDALVRLYRPQIAHTLREIKDPGQFLYHIIPFIQTSADDTLLAFCGELRVERDLEEVDPSANNYWLSFVLYTNEYLQCNCRLCRAEPAEIDSVPVRNGGIVTLAPRNMEASIAPSQNSTHGSTRGRGRVSPLPWMDDKGKTPLHLAAGYCDRNLSQREYQNQFDLVKRLVAWCPASLEVLDSEKCSPYVHRINGLRNNGRSGDNDEIALFLKNQIEQITGSSGREVDQLGIRDKIQQLLRGPQVEGQVPRVPSSQVATAQYSRPTQSEPENYLDLREVQISSASTSKQNVINFINNLQLDDFLQYVHLPKHTFHSSVTIGSGQVGDNLRVALDSKNGSGRRDFESIFKILKNKKVQKIRKLFVDDDNISYHQDDVIEMLGAFEIDEFQWRKMDISSAVLRHAVPRVRTLHLHSSGSHGVLRDWSGSDGLNKLPRVCSHFILLL